MAEKKRKKEDNLIPQAHVLTVEEQSRAGVASGEARRRKRDIRLAMEALLEKQYKGRDGSELSGAEAIALKQMEKALKGDTKAFEVVRDTAGQKPIEKVEQVNIDMEQTQAMEYVKDLMARKDEE